MDTVSDSRRTAYLSGTPNFICCLGDVRAGLSTNRQDERIGMAIGRRVAFTSGRPTR